MGLSRPPLPPGARADATSPRISLPRDSLKVDQQKEAVALAAMKFYQTKADFDLKLVRRGPGRVECIFVNMGGMTRDEVSQSLLKFIDRLEKGEVR